MPVFKLCLHVYKKNIALMLVYFGLFLAISLAVVNANRSTSQKGFSQTKTSIAVITEDQSPLIDGLKESLSQVAHLVDLPNEQGALQDALYFREVSYILRIPADYTEKFMNKEDVKIQKTTLPNSIEAIYINLQVDQFLNLAKLHMNANDMDTSQLAAIVLKDMEIKTTLTMAESEDLQQDQSYSMYYYNYMGYSLFSILILGISTVLLVFNNMDIRRRNACSPIKASHMNLQFLLANMTFSFICWFIYVGFCLVFNYKNSQSFNTLLFILNSFVFTICAASISFLIGTLVKNRQAIAALTNVVALGSSFLGGVFVPQELLADSVLKIASFTPTYWFVRSNNLIGKMTRITDRNLNELMSYIGIELIFATAFIALALVIGKRRQMGTEV